MLPKLQTVNKSSSSFPSVRRSPRTEGMSGPIGSANAYNLLVASTRAQGKIVVLWYVYRFNGRLQQLDYNCSCELLCDCALRLSKRLPINRTRTNEYASLASSDQFIQQARRSGRCARAWAREATHTAMVVRAPFRGAALFDLYQSTPYPVLVPSVQL